MDQLKPAIAWCKKNIFWIGCFLLAVTMIGSWVFSSMQLASKQRESESAIKKQLGDIKRVSGTNAEGADDVNAHPNKSTEAGMAEEMDRTITAIVRGWKKRYEEQKAILTWPEEELGKATCDFFSKIDVPEKVSDPGQGFENFRKRYYDKIPAVMAGICRDLGTNWQYDQEMIEKKAQEERDARDDDDRNGGGFGMGMGGMGAGMGGMGGTGDDITALDEINRFAVNWDKTNQFLWQQKLTQFVGYDDHVGASLYPTYMQANILQQDLWLLEAMFKNIKEINGGSTSNDTSVIRTIDHVVFGREAIIQLGELLQVDARLGGGVAAAGGAMGGPGMAFDDDGEDDMSSIYQGRQMAPGGMGGAVALSADSISYHNRYVDPNFESISATEVKAVLGGAALPEKNLELIVAKRVPFRIAVEMDERKINEFIAICANSEFVFEVNQLRVNRHTANEMIEFNGGAAASNSGGTGGGMSGGMGMAGGMGGMSGGMGMGMNGSSTTPTEKLEPTPVESRTDFLVSVEFYGVVKIYNPVRENFLRLAAGQEVVDETADPAMEASAQAPAQPAAAQAQPAAAAQAGQPAAAAQPAVGQPAAAGQPAATQAPGQPAAPGLPVEGQPQGQPPAQGQPAAAPATGGAAQPAGAPAAAPTLPAEGGGAGNQ